MPNDYIDQIKLTNNTVVDIKDTVSGYITSSDMPITIIEGTLGIPSLTLTLTGVTYQELHTIMSSGRTVVIRADVSTYGVMYVLVSECVHYGSNYAVMASLPVNMTEEGVGTTSFYGGPSESSDTVVLSPTSIVVQEKLAFDGTYSASTNKAATVSTVTNAINALDGGTIGTGSTTKTITSLSQSNGNVSATFSDIAFPTEILTVTATRGESPALLISADVTYADIYAAMVAGKTVIVKFLETAGSTVYGYFYPVGYPYYTGDTLYFSHAEPDSGRIEYLSVTSSDYWEFNYLALAPKYSPTFTGTPKAPTASAGTNTTQIATTAFVKTAITNAIGSAISASY